jgi:ribosomal protein L25 (general stress protein Ctc)
MKLDIRGNLSTKMLQINAYPVAICRNLKALEGALQALDNTAQVIQLIIHQEKTKCMKVNKKTNNEIST